MSELLNFRVPDGVGVQLREEAKKEGHSLSAYLRKRLEPSLGKTASGKPITDDLVEELSERVVGVTSTQTIESLATKIHNTEGVPMRVARQRAKDRLTPQS